MTEVVCHNKHCTNGINGQRKIFQARTVDVKRGWGKFCSKSCKAIHQENKTGQYKNYLCNKANRNMTRFIEQEKMHEAAMMDMEVGWDAHKDVF